MNFYAFSIDTLRLLVTKNNTIVICPFVLQLGQKQRQGYSSIWPLRTKIIAIRMKINYEVE